MLQQNKSKKRKAYFWFSMMGMRAWMNSQNRSNMSYAAIMFCSRITCSTYANGRVLIMIVNSQVNTQKTVGHGHDSCLSLRAQTYPYSSYCFLANLQELGYLLAHVFELQISLILQQFDAWDCQGQARLTTPFTSTIQTSHKSMQKMTPRKACI